jgi:hypothetical protein
MTETIESMVTPIDQLQLAQQLVMACSPPLLSSGPRGRQVGQRTGFDHVLCDVSELDV